MMSVPEAWKARASEALGELPSPPFVTVHPSTSPGPITSIAFRPSSIFAIRCRDTGPTNSLPKNRLRDFCTYPAPSWSSSSQVLHGHPASSARLYLQGTTSRLYCMHWKSLARLPGSCSFWLPGVASLIPRQPVFGTHHARSLDGFPLAHGHLLTILFRLGYL